MVWYVKKDATETAITDLLTSVFGYVFELIVWIAHLSADLIHVKLIFEWRRSYGQYTQNAYNGYYVFSSVFRAQHFPTHWVTNSYVSL